MNLYQKLALVLITVSTSLGFSPNATIAAVTDPALTSSATILPHHAVYAMSLGSARNSSTVRNVTGKMTFNWDDTCDGWAIQQRMNLVFTQTEGGELDVDTQVATWEAKDGSLFRFNIRRMKGGQTEELLRGKAARTDNGVTVSFEEPPNKAGFDLPPESIFPSAHTIMILDKAAHGEKLFSRPVFDGSDDNGAGEISTFIGPQRNDMSVSGFSDEVKKSALFHGPVWPVRLAFYKPDVGEGEPDYEMDLDLQNNGVARAMSINYGDFVVKGALSKLEAAPRPACH